MRLIDADAIKFTEYINGDITVSKETIDNMPTAYNVVRVLEEKIRVDTIDDYTEWLRKTHANFDEDYAEDIKSDYLEQLKEQK